MSTSRIIIQLIHEAILPAVVVIAAKLVGISLGVLVLGISWSVVPARPLPYITFASYQDFLAISSWSNFFVLIVTACGLLWVLFKAHVLHETHITPKLSIQLFNLEMDHLVKNTLEISHQSLVWLAYLWLLIVFLLVQAYFGYFYWWMILIGFLLGLILTWILILDLEREVRLLT